MKKCEICDNKKYELIANRIREGDGRILRCVKCGLIIQDLDWDENRLRDYYDNEYQKTNSLRRGREQTPREHFEDRKKTLDGILRNIIPLLNSKMTVLEVGCGTGELLCSIKNRVKKVIGVELHRGYVEFMNNELGIEAYAKDINKLDLGGRNIDLVISIATLDHLRNPLETLVTMKNIMSNNGKIYIEVPNANEAMNHFLPKNNREAFNTFFWHRAHLFYFTPATISALFKKAGLTCKVSSRHEYSLKNFLHWYYLGRPQDNYVSAVKENNYFEGQDAFEVHMNALLNDTEKKFKLIIAKTMRGDSLCCLGKKSKKEVQE